MGCGRGKKKSLAKNLGCDIRGGSLCGTKVLEPPCLPGVSFRGGKTKCALSVPTRSSCRINQPKRCKVGHVSTGVPCLANRSSSSGPGLHRTARSASVRSTVPCSSGEQNLDMSFQLSLKEKKRRESYIRVTTLISHRDKIKEKGRNLSYMLLIQSQSPVSVLPQRFYHAQVDTILKTPFQKEKEEKKKKKKTLILVNSTFTSPTSVH